LKSVDGGNILINTSDSVANNSQLLAAFKSQQLPKGKSAALKANKLNKSMQ